ncbi:helix-turn-helix transcriptional regulator [Paenibacillus sp. TRM 82003]|uniref:helix-turn-helix domain-containing protein n=1 Tax=Kineococcus sp. TRM81007 TaxID=2925831 RepID=UPI001F55B7AC|nr:helix-turn-helix transcriptional regulator [Kineococcus sp. TRM81007]MCI2239624.1 helix-turn-helix transcriptional regulator [Kineococcus sp. TRM81007]MCI3926094.1 helix-turn-helix transcriptional regulator [Paenibacillus sp. TRM 82003]
MKRTRSLLPATTHALTALGAQIAAGRREHGWSAADLAGRLGVAPALVGRIERGAPGTAVGTVLEAAIVCGVPLFSVDAEELPGVAALARDRLALLPRRVHRRRIEIDDDF